VRVEAPTGAIDPLHVQVDREPTTTANALLADQEGGLSRHRRFSCTLRALQRYSTVSADFTRCLVSSIRGADPTTSSQSNAS
jgi:hypothetical protein